jgi:hypothetical protein
VAFQHASSYHINTESESNNVKYDNISGLFRKFTDVSEECLQTLTELHDVINDKTVLFITTAAKFSSATNSSTIC